MWFLIALFIGGLILGLAMKPNVTSQKPAGLSEVTAPIAQDGAEMPVLFGTRDLTGPNCVWYGDLKTKAIKSSGSKK